MGRDRLIHIPRLFLVEALLVLAFAGCSCTEEVPGPLTSASPSSPTQPAGDDFSNSRVISNNTGLADGTTPLVVTIQLINSDNSHVSGFTPTFDILSGAGVTASGCSSSDTNGRSNCSLVSSVVGTKKIGFTNIKITLERDLVFAAVAGDSAFGIEAAALPPQTSAGGYSMSASAGSVQSDLVKVSSGNWKLFGGPRAGVISE